MRRNITLALAGALALSAIAAGNVDTTHACYDETAGEVVYADTQNVFFHESDAKLGNAASAAGWDENAPTDSVQSGAGAMTVSPPGSLAATAADSTGDTGTSQEAVFAGTFDGCIDTIAVDLFSFDPTNRSGTSGTAEPANHNFGLTVIVDGYEVYTGGPLEAATTLDNEGFGPNLNKFALNLGGAIETYAQFYPDLSVDGEHTIELKVVSWYANTGTAAYLWDTTEVPSGMTFNGGDLEGYSVVG